MHDAGITSQPILFIMMTAYLIELKQILDSFGYSLGCLGIRISRD